MSLEDLLRRHLESLDGEFIFAIEAEKFVRNADSATLDAFLRANAVRLVAAEMRGIVRAARTGSRHDQKRTRFATAAAGLDVDGLAAFTVFEVPYPINAEHVQRRLGDMKREHCLGAADFYHREALPFLMEEAFFRAVAKKVGTKTVAEAFTEDQIRALRRNLGVTAAA